MASSEDARGAIYKAIVKALGDTEALNVTTRAVAIRELAVAFRAAHGGAQPGSVTVEK